MRKLFLCLMIVVCASCARNHGKPIANITYLGVDRYLDRNIYPVSFSSDVDVVSLFKSRIGLSLLCPLDEDKDFSIAHQMSNYGEGLIEPIITDDGPAFKADLMFFKRNDSTNQKLLKSDELRSWLGQRESLACKVRINSYSYKVYLSETMNIPTADLLREVNKY